MIPAMLRLSGRATMRAAESGDLADLGARLVVSGGHTGWGMRIAVSRGATK
jgi:hypothetical protein